MDTGDTSLRRWQNDEKNPQAMNVDMILATVDELQERVFNAVKNHSLFLVIGGDCTVEIGSVIGTKRVSNNIGLIYIDLDADLQTPLSTQDGALDWMVVAHLLAIPGTNDRICNFMPSVPILNPGQIFLFGTDNIKDAERKTIDAQKINLTKLSEVKSDPSTAAFKVLQDWAYKFENLIIHLDVDVLNFNDFPLAENTRRNWGLKFSELLEALKVFTSADNFSGITITEINPDHTDNKGEILRLFSEEISKIFE